MKPYLFYSIAITFSVSLSCSSSKKAIITQEPVQKKVDTSQKNTTVSVKTDSLLKNLLAAHPQYFEQILQYAKEWKVQIIYTQIDRDENNMPLFKDYFF